MQAAPVRPGLVVASNINWTTVVYVVMHCTFDITMLTLAR